MPRQPRPWRRKSVGGAWYSTIGGEKVWLAPADATKTQAQAALTAELAARHHGVTVRRDSLSASDVIRLYLQDRIEAVARGELLEESRRGVGEILASFAESFGTLSAASLKPAAVEAWVRAQARWNPSTRARATSVIKGCLRWAKRSGYLISNPLEEIRGPAPLRREAILTREQFAKILEAAIPAQRDLLNALLWTGCRPIEVRTLTADRVDLDAGTWRVRDKIRGKTGYEHRTVYLNDEAIALSRRLLAEHPEGLVFRNSRGLPWNRSALSHAMKKHGVRLGFGPECTAYSARHLFATDLLERGVAPATVAELMGHKSLAMVLRVYSHLRERTEHLRDAVRTPPPGDD